MVKMPADVKETLEKQKPVPIATASKSGVPNVVFVGLLKIIDDETLMARIEKSWWQADYAPYRRSAL